MLVETLQRTFLARLVATPRGRAHLLNQVADAESNGESTIFDSALALVDDPELRRFIARHAADEVEHARAFTERRDAQGVDIGPAPTHLRVVDRIDRKLGGFFARGVRSRRDVMDAYLVLQVVEERACTQFPLFSRVFRDVEPETAALFDRVQRDEERHLKYCHAISRRYAPSEAVRRSTLAEMRAVESECFAENSRAGLAWVLDRGYASLSPLEALGFRSLLRVGKVVDARRPTPFAARDARSSPEDSVLRPTG